MAQDVVIAGAAFSDVPAVDLPKVGGGTARFADPSATTATPADVVQGKIFLTAQGAQATGTATGGVGLDALAITTPPAKTAYKVGESFDPAGMVVTATYTNGATLVVGGYTVTPQVMTLGVTAVTVAYAEGGVSRTAQQSVTVTRTQLPIPTAAGALTYDGSAQSPTLTNDPGALAARSGDTSATNAGGYELTLSLVDPDAYEWATGSTADLTVPWSIGKAPANLAVSPASVTLDASHLTATSSITTDSDGALTVETSDSSVVTGSISNKVLTARHVNKTSGSATLTVRQAATTNYKAAGVQIPVTAKFTTIYGVTWDGTATQSLTRTDAAAGFSDPVPYVAGASSYGSPFDDLSPWKDIVRVTDAEAGEMVKIPKFYYKLTQSGSTISVQIADSAADGFSVCPACMNRGDGKGERDYVLVGRYHCANSTYKSTSGVKPQVSLQQSTFRTNIHNLGSNVYMMDFATRFTIWLLYIVEFANWDSQKTIGKGCGNNSAVENMGYTDSMPYHTGTTLSSRDTYGVSTQYRYMEGLWDNCYDRLTGCYNASSGLMVEVNPANFAENSGGVSVGTPANGWIAGLTVSTSGPFPCFINSSTSGGGENAYVGDFWYFNASNPVVCVGGYYYQGGFHGMFSVYCTGLTNAGVNLGSRVLKLP